MLFIVPEIIICLWNQSNRVEGGSGMKRYRGIVIDGFMGIVGDEERMGLSIAFGLNFSLQV